MTESPAENSVDRVASEVERRPLGWWKHLSFSVTHALASALLAILSPNGFSRFGRAFGTVEWLINHKRRRRFRRALSRVLEHEPSRAERRRFTREHFIFTRCDKLFYLVSDRIPKEKAKNLLIIDNQSVLDEAVARGRGVHIALSHHGALHMAAMLVSLRGYKIAGVRDRHESGIRQYVQTRFDRLYPEFARLQVLFEDSFPREIYRFLRKGYLLGSAMDVSRVRRDTQRFEEVSIFGERRQFLTGPLWIALRCGAPVLQAFVVPGEGLSYRAKIVDTLLDPETVEDEAAAVTRAIQAYARNVEKQVRAMPSLLTRL